MSIFDNDTGKKKHNLTNPINEEKKKKKETHFRKSN